MKLLEKSELGGIDSTSKTITKWDEFLKKAVYRLGFRQSLIDNMYPYEKGIPLNNGEYLPVDETTGRRFFQMSWADKLTMCLAPLTTLSFSNDDLLWTKAFRYAVLTFVMQKSAFDKVFPDRNDYETLKEVFDNTYTNSSLTEGKFKIDMPEVLVQVVDDFLTDSDLLFLPYVNGAGKRCYRLRKNEAHGIANGTFDWSDRIGTHASLLVSNHTLENVYDKGFPYDELRNAAEDVRSYFSGWASKLTFYSEVYLQDYLVISLNPIDKLMCSTKQAFSSCMSLSKQDDVTGTASMPALNLPSLFPTDSVFMIFMTPGKHKNMYWESEQWMLPGEERDKEKAYKYLKMTCRALTYKCVAPARLIDKARDWSVEGEEETASREYLMSDMERLYVGRQYAAKGEDYLWEFVISYLMARQGIATNMSVVDPLLTIYNSGAPSDNALLDHLSWTELGILADKKVVSTDRYGYCRGIYFDNLTFNLANARQKGGAYVSVEEFPIASLVEVKVGGRRTGSYSIASSMPRKSGLDVFKLFNNEQDYSWVNNNVKICSDCGAMLTAEEEDNVLDDSGRRMCNACLKRHHVVKCEQCGGLYTEEEADDHKVYNIIEIIDPAHSNEREPVFVCKKQLMKARVEYSDGNFICAHCGKLETSYWSSLIASGSFKEIDVDDMHIRVSVCGTCLRHATMCDKCKRIIFLDDIQDACLLLPNRRVICPDCLDKIRMKQEKRDLVKSILKNLKPEDVEEDPAVNARLEDEIARLQTEKGYSLGNPDTLIKDIFKQVRSYKASHPDVGLPEIREPGPAIVEEEEIELPF